MTNETEERARRMLLGDVKNHRMTVLKDEGLYRHVRFGKPNGSSIYRFDLVTWPGHLVITGDLQDYHFARLPDMFQFFRSNPDRPRINAHYWAEKLVGHHQKYEDFDFDRFKEAVVEHFMWSRDSIPEGRSRDVWKAIREEILEAEGVDYSQDLAYKAASDFFFSYNDNGWGRPGFGFEDVWEWPMKDFDHHFLVSLWAIVWGIQQWDTREHKSPLDWEREDHQRTRTELANLRRYHGYV